MVGFNEHLYDLPICMIRNILSPKRIYVVTEEIAYQVLSGARRRTGCVFLVVFLVHRCILEGVLQKLTWTICILCGSDYVGNVQLLSLIHI